MSLACKELARNVRIDAPAIAAIAIGRGSEYSARHSEVVARQVGVEALRL
jgi:hypothetical protein